MSFVGGTPNNFEPSRAAESNKTELKPLEVNGITAVTLGTIIWTFAFVGLLISNGWLRENDRLHWIGISASGIALGLLGYRYTTNRVKRLGLEREPNLFNRLIRQDPDQSQLIQDFE